MTMEFPLWSFTSLFCVLKKHPFECFVVFVLWRKMQDSNLHKHNRLDGLANRSANLYGI